MYAGKIFPVVTLVLLISKSVTSSNEAKVNDKKLKSITTFLNAKWETTPVVLELAEYLATENTNLFWPYIDNINALKTKLDILGTEKDIYEACIGVASSLVSPAQLRMAKLAISMHITSPIVRMFDQIATQNGAKEASCNTFVNVASKKICDNDELENILKSINNYAIEEHKLETYSLDHYYNVFNPNNTMTAILYGQLGSSDFAAKHKILTRFADSGAVNYIVRWNVKAEGRPKVRLSGYGVELQLKSTEYKSQDDSTPKENESSDVPTQLEEEDENDPQNQVGGFNFSKLKNLFPALRTPLERFRRHLSESSEELAPLKVWQMQGLSMQAAAAVVDAHVSGSDEALKVLKSISQNFPMQAKSLIHVNVPRAFRDEVLSNQDIWSSSFGLRAAESLLLVSGIQYSPDELDFYTLLEDLKEDIGPMNVLRSIGLSKKLINELMGLGLDSFTFEEYGIDIRDTAITWLNDLEKDERYRRWPSEYYDLLKPTYPGMLRHLRRNIFNYIMVVDPISKSSLPPLTMAENLIKHSAPVRVGIILAPVKGRTGEQLALESAVRAAFNYVSQEKNSNKEAFYYMTQLLESTTGEEVTIDNIKKTLKKFAYPSANLDDIISEDSEYNFGRQVSEEFVSKLGTKLPEVLVNGVPVRDESGSPVTSSLDLLEVTLVGTLWRSMEGLQKAIFKGELSNQDDAVDYLMKQPHIVPRLNRRVLSSESSQYLDLSGVAASSEMFTEDKIHKLLTISGRDALATAVSVMKYFVNSNKPEDYTQTIWVIGDLNQKESRQLLRDALTFMSESRGVRVAFIPNIEGKSDVDQSLNKVVMAAQLVNKPVEAAKYVVKLLENDGCHERKDCDIWPDVVPILNKNDWILKTARILCVRSMKLRPFARAIVHNARLIGPFDDDEVFAVEDFALLERFSNQIYAGKLSEVLDKKGKKASLDDDDDESNVLEMSADLRMKVSAVLASRKPRIRTPIPSTLKTDHSVVELPPLYDNEPAIEIVAVLDPASTAAQRLSPVLLLLRKVINCNIKLFMNPQDKNSDMPLKSFYRFVVESEPVFSSSGTLVKPMARFTGLPQGTLLSMELRTPPNWLVECVHSVYDLDNIRLADVDSLVHSEFELEYLLLEGHAVDMSTEVPPRGLELMLGTNEKPDVMDTIVMSNLGYFQLKANPGAWLLKLRPGRSDDIYQIFGHDDTEIEPGSNHIQVLMSSFLTNRIKLRVNKKPDKINANLLDDDDKGSSGIWNSIASSFGGSDEKESGDETINVFSVASGHLYERFLRIMMLSVLKNTKSPVKFWFLKNYLSPSLKDILPYMAQEYGFEYELVQYQWPRWLQNQRDRQRTIWGYKILFLDVLFPLSIKKIIFVDADQIVRADLKELVDLDLGGAPYGYTPFCESRKEMDGFRFWKHGYWRNHLLGRSYHISALYVVDLKRFRFIAAGDRLRRQYQALSQDPNSLSNLDQDLPNNMIHQVAIKSLPQEWLWCETWCDDDSKKKAKTIDLCNNPMTKEAKLSAAMRIVPEWKEYDSEIKSLMARVQRGLYQTSDHEQVNEEPSESKHHADHTEL